MMLNSKAITIPEGIVMRSLEGGKAIWNKFSVFANDLHFELSEDGTHYVCVGVADGMTETTVTVPGTANSTPVSAVGSGAFSALPGLTKVIFQTTPESIAEDAFAGTKLATVVIPSDTDALNNLPWGSSTLRPRFEIGGIIYRIHNSNSGRYVLDGTTSAFKGGKVEFLDYVGTVRVYEIDSSSFKGKTTITEVVINSTMYAIEASAFANCTGLTKVTFKGTPNTIPATMFDGCTNLLDIYVPWAEGAKANAPWGATNATIHYNYTME